MTDLLVLVALAVFVWWIVGRAAREKRVAQPRRHDDLERVLPDPVEPKVSAPQAPSGVAERPHAADALGDVAGVPLTDRSSLPDQQSLLELDRDLRELLEAGRADRALAALVEAAQANGHGDLAVVTRAAMEHADLRGWEHVRRDAAEAMDAAPRPVLVSLQLLDDGRITRWVSDAEGRPLGLAPGNTTEAVVVDGLERLLDVARSPYDVEAGQHGNARRRLLTGWVVAALVVRAVMVAARRDPLPHGAALEVRPFGSGHSREPGPGDLLPRFCVRVVTEDAAPDDAAEQLRRERRAERESALQRTWIDDFAERREIHRMLRYVPFYRARGRARAAEMWELRLSTTCRAVGLDPLPATSWRMSGGELASILRRIAEARQVPDVEDALDPAHTDALHAHWLGIAEAGDFRIDPGMSLFEIQFASLLQDSGPIAHDRWQRAKPYAQEMLA